MPVITHGSEQGPQGTPLVLRGWGRLDASPVSFCKEGRPATCAVARSRCRSASEPASPEPACLGRRRRVSRRPPASPPRRTCTPSPHPRSHPHPHLCPQRLQGSYPWSLPYPAPPEPAPISPSPSLPSTQARRGLSQPIRGRGRNGVDDLAAGADSAPSQENKRGTYRSAPPGTPT